MPRKTTEKSTTKKPSTRKKKTEVVETVAETAAEITPVNNAPAAPAKRGKKSNTAAEAVKTEAPVKKTRTKKPKTAAAEAPAPKKRTRKKAAPETVAEVTAVETATAIVEDAPAPAVPETVVEIAEPVVEAIPAETAPAEETPVKKSRKPRAKKDDAAPVKRGRKPKEPSLVLTTTLQVGDAEFDISDIALKAYKEYKSVHKRKVVTDFHIYVKPEEGVAYFTVNGEGAAEFRIDLK